MVIGAAEMQWLPTSAQVRSYGIANGLNQLPSEAAGAVVSAIVWDKPTGLNSGNMESASLDGSAERTTFAHDALNRLVAASKAGMSAFYDYDVDDRRVRKAVARSGPEDVTRTLWSGTDELAECDGAGTLLRRVIPGPGIDDKVATI